jgi:hypothetical protein
LFGFSNRKVTPPTFISLLTDESPEQMRWAEEFLCALDDMDSRQILTVFLFYPNDVEGSSEGRETKFQPPRERMFSVSGKLDMTWLIENEWGAEAGNMLLAGKSLNSIECACLDADLTQFVEVRDLSFVQDKL